MAVSGLYDSAYTPASLVDGIKDSSRYRVGYWVAPDNQPHAWVELQVTPSTIIYLSDLPALDVRVHHLTSLTQPVPVGGMVYAHSLFTHPLENEPRHVAYALNGNYRTLSRAATISDWAGEGSVTPLTFRIVGDGKELLELTAMQKTGVTKPVNVSVSGVTKLEIFVDCPGNTHAAQATWIDLELTRAGATPAKKAKNASNKLPPKVSDSPPGIAGGGVTADRLVVYNCNNHGAANFGMLSCNVELRKAGQVVWSKAAIPLAWNKDSEPSTTIPLPNVPFDAVRIESATSHDLGPAISRSRDTPGRQQSCSRKNGDGQRLVLAGLSTNHGR